MIIAYILFSIILFIILLWLAGFFMINDFSIKTIDYEELRSKKILIIFPHPDDEVMSCGGFIHKLSKTAEITLHILTKGEKGTPNGKTDLKLKEIRTKEAQEVSKILGINNLIIDDYGDGELKNKKPRVTKRISEIIKKIKPYLIITYDLSGLYGHEDHIAVSEIATKLAKTRLWYVSVPEKLYKFIKLPEHMAKDLKFRDRRKYPTLKAYAGFRRIMALYAYKSQLSGFKKSFPMLPLWFSASMRVYEYFYEVEK